MPSYWVLRNKVTDEYSGCFATYQEVQEKMNELNKAFDNKPDETYGRLVWSISYMEG
jgi:hypothetical protein